MALKANPHSLRHCETIATASRHCGFGNRDCKGKTREEALRSYKDMGTQGLVIPAAYRGMYISSEETKGTSDL